MNSLAYSSKYSNTSFLQKVFAWMSAALALTAILAWWGSNNSELVNFLSNNPLILFGAFAVQLLLVILLSWKIRSLSSTVASLGFFLYAGLNGITFSLLLSLYSNADVFGAFAVTSIMFGALATWGYATKKDLSSWGSILFMALIGLIVASVVNLFIASSLLYWAVTYLGVLIFSALTAYDVQKIKEMGQSGEFAGNMAILGALMLYLDFINLFIYILRIYSSISDR